VARDAAGGVGGADEERVGGARVEEDKDDLRAFLERAVKLMVKAGYRSLLRDHQGGGEREEVRLDGVPLLPGHGRET
jgi:hypothetical protein